MGVGTAIDVTNRAVVIADCSISGTCRYCKQVLCAGCANMPVFIEEGLMVCTACQYEQKVPLPEQVRLFSNVDDYLDHINQEDEG